MQLKVRCAGLAVAVLGMCMACAAQDQTQNQGQDHSKIAKRPGTALRPEARIDINRATVEELLKVKGMTRSWAGRIVRFRPYRSKLDLVDKGVVTAEIYDRIKHSVIAHRAPQ